MRERNFSSKLTCYDCCLQNVVGRSLLSEPIIIEQLISGSIIDELIMNRLTTNDERECERGM